MHPDLPLRESKTLVFNHLFQTLVNSQRQSATLINLNLSSMTGLEMDMQQFLVGKKPKIEVLIPNTDDNLHCLQCCYAMIINSIFKDNITPFDAETDTNFKIGLPTWPFKAMYSFAQKGLRVINIENFPIDLFLSNPNEAIKMQMRDEDVAEYIISVSNFPVEQKLVKDAIESGRVEFVKRIPCIDDIKSLLAMGWFVICNVNCWVFEGEPDKYAGHFVIVESCTDNSVILQNPGAPAHANQVISIDTFLEAWNYPDVNAANIIAVSPIISDNI